MLRLCCEVNWWVLSPEESTCLRDMIGPGWTRQLLRQFQPIADRRAPRHEVVAHHRPRLEDALEKTQQIFGKVVENESKWGCHVSVRLSIDYP